MPNNIKITVPRTIWTLGSGSQTKVFDGRVTRPLYYQPKDSDRLVHVGEINPEYAEPLMKVLGKVTKS